jgi:hypothetical protein
LGARNVLFAASLATLAGVPRRRRNFRIINIRIMVFLSEWKESVAPPACPALSGPNPPGFAFENPPPNNSPAVVFLLLREINGGGSDDARFSGIVS